MTQHAPQHFDANGSQQFGIRQSIISKCHLLVIFMGEILDNAILLEGILLSAIFYRVSFGLVCIILLCMCHSDVCHSAV